MSGLINGELVDVAKEYELLAKLKIVDEKDLSAFKNEIGGGVSNEDIDVRNAIYVTSYCFFFLIVTLVVMSLPLCQEDSRFIRELSLAAENSRSNSHFTSLEEELNKFELIEENYIESDAAPKKMSTDHITSSIQGKIQSKGSGSEKPSAKSSGWKAGFLVSQSKEKIKTVVRSQLLESSPVSQSTNSVNLVKSTSSEKQKKAFNGEIFERC